MARIYSEVHFFPTKQIEFVKKTQTNGNGFVGSVAKSEKTQPALLEIFDVFVYVTVLDNVF